MIAVDPGAAGGLVREHNQIIEAVKMPATDAEIAKFLQLKTNHDGGQVLSKTAYLEDLVKYTGRNMPSSAMAIYAGNWGFIKGCLTAYGYRIIIVPPKKWQKALGLGAATGMSRTEWKNKLKDEAQRLNPQVKVTLATADALLIYEAAKRGLLE